MKNVALFAGLLLLVGCENQMTSDANKPRKNHFASRTVITGSNIPSGPDSITPVQGAGVADMAHGHNTAAGGGGGFSGPNAGMGGNGPR